MSSCAVVLRSSPHRWLVVPAPPEAKLSASGFALASAMTSVIDFAGSCGCATQRFGVVAALMTGVRSFCGLYAISLYSHWLVARMAEGAMSTVCPLGSPLATMAAPTLPPAPGRFSITTGTLMDRERIGAIARGSRSEVLPGEYGTTTVICRAGKV